MILVDIAGLPVAIHAPSAAWSAVLAARYGAFLADVPPAWDVTVRERDLPDAPDPYVRHDGPVTRFRYMVYEGEIDLAARRAWVSTPSEARLGPAVDRILAWVLMQALPRAGDGLLLHALGLERAGRGYAFAGATGAGKTTVAGLADGFATVLCNENIVHSPSPDGSVDLLSTPLWGMSTPPERVRRVNRRVPLAALFLLEQAPDFGLRRLGAAEAVGRLLGTEKVATERVDSAEAWLAAAASVLAVVPAYVLAFRPEAGLWVFLDAAMPYPAQR